jgi:hypothetical protein
MIENFEECSDVYITNDFFLRYITAFIPGIYRTIATDASNMTGRDFFRYWSWAFESLMKATSTEYSVGNVSGYALRNRSVVLAGVSSNIAEIYKSSFLKTVDWYRKSGWIDDEFSADWSLKICPIDLASWEISAGEIPDWWPRRVTDSSGLEVLEEFSKLEALRGITSQEGSLFAAEGAVIANKTEGLVSSHFSLLPFAYKVHGKNLPQANVLAPYVKRHFWEKAPTAPHPLAVFEGTMDGWLPFFEEDFPANQLEVRPIISWIKFLNVSAWQPQRISHPPLFPGYSLVNGGVPVHDKDSWGYSELDSRVFTGRDWRIGSVEWNDKGSYLQHGQYAFVDQRWVERKLEFPKWRIAHLLTLDVKQRKYQYEEAKEVTTHRVLDLSNLVL